MRELIRIHSVEQQNINHATPKTTFALYVGAKNLFTITYAGGGWGGGGYSTELYTGGLIYLKPVKSLLFYLPNT